MGFAGFERGQLDGWGVWGSRSSAAHRRSLKFPFPQNSTVLPRSDFFHFFLQTRLVRTAALRCPWLGILYLLAGQVVNGPCFWQKVDKTFCARHASDLRYTLSVVNAAAGLTVFMLSSHTGHWLAMGRVCLLFVLGSFVGMATASLPIRAGLMKAGSLLHPCIYNGVS